MIKLASILHKILKEEEQTAPMTVADTLNRFKVLKGVLEDLLVSGMEGEYDKDDDISKLVSDIEIIVFKPTTFRIKFKNGSSMNLKYDPTPLERNPAYKGDYKPRDYFECQILGKKYSLTNRSEYLKAIDYIGRALSEKPIGGADQKDQDEPTTDTSDIEPETNSDEDNGEE